MNSPSHERITDLFLEARKLEGEARESFLKKLHPEDRAEVVELLAHDIGTVSSDSESAAPSSAADSSPTGSGPRLLGDFEIIREVGRGGMGITNEPDGLYYGPGEVWSSIAATVTKEAGTPDNRPTIEKTAVIQLSETVN